MRAFLLAGLAVASIAVANQFPEFKVSLAKTPKSVKAGSPIKASVMLEVPNGYHAYAPGQPNVLPVEITAPAGAKCKLLKATFPKGEEKSYEGGDKAWVYEGKTEIQVSLSTPKNASGKLLFKVVVKAQLCSNVGGTCYPPQEIILNGAVKVTP
jgi:hypothetical protein